jgi:hypothetical protein
MSGMSESRSLQHLEASDARVSPPAGKRSTDTRPLQVAALSLLACCTTLRYLDLSQTSHADADEIPRLTEMHVLSGCAALETLVLMAPTAGKDVAELPRLVGALPQLRHLQLVVRECTKRETVTKLRQFRNESEAKRRLQQPAAQPVGDARAPSLVHVELYHFIDR